MLKGIVNLDDEPVVPIAIKLTKTFRTARAIIDTGFNGFLSVPASVVQRANWTELGEEEYEIASGELMKAKVYEGTVQFDKKALTIPVTASHSGDILIGTKLLMDKLLSIDFKRKSVKVHNA